MIAVIYNSDIWSPDLVRDSLTEKLNRVALVPAKEVPNFYGKDPTALQTIYEKGNEMFKEKGDRKTVLEAIRPEIEDFKDQGRLYGLTRAEYSFLRIIQREGQEHPDLIVGPELLTEAARLFEEVI